MNFLALAVGLFLPTLACAQQLSETARYNIHFQATVIDQGNFPFHSPYSGVRSLKSSRESATTMTSTLFLGLRLLPGTEIYLDPEVTGGEGLSGSKGVAGFPNGEAFRAGDPKPTLSLARLFFHQVIGLSDEKEIVSDGPNQLAGPVAAQRLTFAAGKFCVADYLDNNAYSDDPRSQFMNWALMGSGAWDYPADARGYTWGLMGEYHASPWAARATIAAEPKEANMLYLDRDIGRAHGLAIEGEREFRWGGRRGTVRLLAFLNKADMGNYDKTIALARETGTTPDITQTRAQGRTKYGFTSSNDLEITDRLGGFIRLSWNDGQNESWTYSEIDASQAVGLTWKPAAWGRPKDDWGIAQVVNEISGPHRRYLAGGGHGFLIGDGAMHYGPEIITETYYRFQALDSLSISPDAQLIINPAYNRSRGPVPVWGVRVHAEF